MCLVEVEKAPKLAPACVTAVAEGQVVHVSSPSALKARESVLEFLLINHPLDCPICDQAGECELQNYTFQEGRPGTRYKEYAKRYNPVEDFGPDILYVPNRCVLCTRCVRFMDDVADTPLLNVSERGDRAVIGIAESQKLDHPWAGNVVDLCPVGSLLSKDFLHKARAWDLDKSASICPGCTQGCNISIDTRDDIVVRLRPRANLEVNRHFICDYGRMNYRWMNRGDRIEAPLVREAGRHVAVDWDTALDRFGTIVRGASGSAVILASGRASVESLGLVRQLVDRLDVTAAIKVPVGEEAPLPGIPGLALRRERVPNLAGAELLGYTSRGRRRLAPRRARRWSSCSMRISRWRTSGPGRHSRPDPATRDRGHRLAASSGAHPSHRQHGRRERDVRQSRPANPALSPGEVAAGHGAPGLVDRRRGPGRARARRGRAFDGGERHSRSSAPGGRSLPGPPTPTSASRGGCCLPRGRSGAMTPELKGFLLLSIIKMLVVFTIT